MRLLVKRGFNILELVVGMSVLLAFLTMSYLTLAQGVRFVKETDTYAYPQKESAVLVRRLSEELSNSHERWVIPGLKSGSIRFLSAENLDKQTTKLDFDTVSGKPIWKKWVCYHWNSTQQAVTRYELGLSPTTASLTNEPDPGYLPDEFPTIPNISKRVVGRNIVDFKILPSGTSQHTLTVTAEKLVPIANKNPERVRVTLTATVVILNQDQ